MPPLLTYIARVSDGLPLVGSFAPSEESLDEQKSQARDILRGLAGRVGYVYKQVEPEIYHVCIFWKLFLTHANYLEQWLKCPSKRAPKYSTM